MCEVVDTDTNLIGGFGMAGQQRPQLDRVMGCYNGTVGVAIQYHFEVRFLVVFGHLVLGLSFGGH